MSEYHIERSNNISFPNIIIDSHFFGLKGGKPIPLHGFGKGSYSHLPGLRELLSVWPGNSYQVVPSYSCKGAKGVVMICLCLRYSVIFFCNNGKVFTSVPKGLHLNTWVLLSFLYMCIPHKVQTFRSTSIVSSGRLQVKMPKMRLHLAESSQAISEVYLLIFMLFQENHYMPKEPHHALL